MVESSSEDFPATDAYRHGEVSVPWAMAEVLRGDDYIFLGDYTIYAQHEECCYAHTDIVDGWWCYAGRLFGEPYHRLRGHGRVVDRHMALSYNASFDTSEAAMQAFLEQRAILEAQ